MPVAAPDPIRHTHPLAVLVSELWEQRSGGDPYPPGETGFSLARGKRFIEDPAGLLVDCYERFGPIFTLRLLHRPNVFMIGPAANHYMNVSNTSNFTIRESNFREFVELVGDGVLMSDGEYHRWSRAMVLPAFHRESIVSYFEVMVEETERALADLAPGQSVDIHPWARSLVRRTVMRALFGLDPDGERARSAGVVGLFEKMHTITPLTGMVRLPGTPWARLMGLLHKLDLLIYGEIAARRERGGGGSDIISMLVEARDEDGVPLTDLQIRDQVMTLLLAALETTASTLTFLVYELARRPDVAERIAVELQGSLEDGRPNVAQLVSGELHELELAIDETLRMYPGVWIGPRRATEAFEFEGATVPAGAYVNYCPLASHRLPDVFPEPERFKPERFEPEAKAALPKGAYVPFGGGPRKCIGMRFAQLAIRTAAALLLQRFEVVLPADYSLSVVNLPMLMPKEGMPVVLGERAVRRDPALTASG
jgi:cytochrome P450